MQTQETDPFPSQPHQNIAVWTQKWLPDTFDRVRSFFSVENQQSQSTDLDLIDVPWLKANGPHGFILQIPAVRGLVLVPFFLEPAIHAAWLASWPVNDQGLPDPKRPLFHPKALGIGLDMEHHILFLRQQWKNPAMEQLSAFGPWDLYSQPWQLLLENRRKNLPLTILVPADLHALSQCQSGSLPSQEQLLFAQWTVSEYSLVTGIPNRQDRPSTDSIH